VLVSFLVSRAFTDFYLKSLAALLGQDFVHQQNFHHWQHATTHRLRELYEAPTAEDRRRAAGLHLTEQLAMPTPPPLQESDPSRFSEPRLEPPSETSPAP